MSAGPAQVWTAIGKGRETGGILIVADHASAHVPADIELGVSPDVLTRHIAIDIGVAPLAHTLCATLPCDAILAGVSRLVCDFNRDEDAPGLLPIASDGIAIPGNAVDEAGRSARVERFFHPYHAAVADAVARLSPGLIVALHSFTPRLESHPDQARPWQVGILYNRDDRAARVAIPLLEAAGIVTGDNEPYSGRVLNTTMNRHAEAAGISYLSLEVRQDLIGDTAGVARWAAKLLPVISATWDSVSCNRHDAGRRFA